MGALSVRLTVNFYPAKLPLTSCQQLTTVCTMSTHNGIEKKKPRPLSPAGALLQRKLSIFYNLTAAY